MQCHLWLFIVMRMSDCALQKIINWFYWKMLRIQKRIVILQLMAHNAQQIEKAIKKLGPTTVKPKVNSTYFSCLDHYSRKTINIQSTLPIPTHPLAQYLSNRV